jgi:hypothetical protein
LNQLADELEDEEILRKHAAREWWDGALSGDEPVAVAWATLDRRSREEPAVPCRS